MECITWDMARRRLHVKVDYEFGFRLWNLSFLIYCDEFNWERTDHGEISSLRRRDLILYFIELDNLG